MSVSPDKKVQQMNMAEITGSITQQSDLPLLAYHLWLYLNSLLPNTGPGTRAKMASYWLTIYLFQTSYFLYICRHRRVDKRTHHVPSQRNGTQRGCTAIGLQFSGTCHAFRTQMCLSELCETGALFHFMALYPPRFITQLPSKHSHM